MKLTGLDEARDVVEAFLKKFHAQAPDGRHTLKLHLDLNGIEEPLQTYKFSSKENLQALSEDVVSEVEYRAEQFGSQGGSGVMSFLLRIEGMAVQRRFNIEVIDPAGLSRQRRESGACPDEGGACPDEGGKAE